MADQAKYWGSTAAGLDHYFGNYVSIARLMHGEGIHDLRELEPLKREFLSGLTQVIAENRPVHAGITNDHLREMISLAERDWSDIGTIKGLYRRHFQLKGKEHEVDALFRP